MAAILIYFSQKTPLILSLAKTVQSVFKFR